MVERVPGVMFPHVPPEILQTIFRNLGFNDLLRCKQVNKYWASALPGTDPILNHRLFASTARIVKTKPSKMPMLMLRPIIHMWIIPEEKQLPDLGYDIVLHCKVKSRRMPKHRRNHPIIQDFPCYMSLVNKYFNYTEEWDQRQQLLFGNFRQLANRLSSDPEDYGNWKEQLMCIPAVDQLDIRLLWHKPDDVNDAEVNRVLRTRKMEKGVTVGEVVRTVRKMITRYAVRDIKKFSHKLEINVCDRCHEAWSEWGFEHSDGSDWERESEDSEDEGDEGDEDGNEDEGMKEDNSDEDDSEDDSDKDGIEEGGT
jgi:hypothetical protein